MNETGLKEQSDSQNRVLKKLEQLADRVPGKITAPAVKEGRTLIACQLVKIAGDRVVIQIGQNAYEIPLEVIEDIQDLQNPVEVEKETGVDVVVLVKGWNTRSQIGDGILRGELPFPLVKPSKTCELTEEDRLLVRARAERWMKLNGLLFEIGKAGDLDMCTAMTQMGAGDMTCDLRDPLQDATL